MTFKLAGCICLAQPKCQKAHEDTRTIFGLICPMRFCEPRLLIDDEDKAGLINFPD